MPNQTQSERGPKFWKGQVVQFAETGRVVAFTAEKVCVNFGTAQEPVTVWLPKGFVKAKEREHAEP